ncbi:hypothetical protein RUND412_008475 [Rhizina undulata]
MSIPTARKSEMFLRLSNERQWQALKHENTAIKILSHASEHNYGVLAAVIYDLPSALALIRAAESCSSPLFLLLFPWALKLYGPHLVTACLAAARSATVPVAVHLDHASDIETIKAAAELRLDSIMIDMSALSLSENLSRTRELSLLCHSWRVATEAECGRIEGGEDGVDVLVEEGEEVISTVEDVEKFIATGVDMVAVAVGNVHGGYGPEGPKIDLERLASIHKATKSRVHLVLHGTSGFSEDLLRDCIKSGLVKININRDVWRDYHEHRRINSGMEMTMFIEVGMEKIGALAEKYMHICGSAGKAEVSWWIEKEESE